MEASMIMLKKTILKDNLIADDIVEYNYTEDYEVGVLLVETEIHIHERFFRNNCLATGMDKSEPRFPWS